jgi:hypothetical protein
MDGRQSFALDHSSTNDAVGKAKLVKQVACTEVRD